MLYINALYLYQQIYAFLFALQGFILFIFDSIKYLVLVMIQPNMEQNIAKAAFDSIEKACLIFQSATDSETKELKLIYLNEYAYYLLHLNKNIQPGIKLSDNAPLYSLISELYSFDKGEALIQLPKGEFSKHVHINNRIYHTQSFSIGNHQWLVIVNPGETHMLSQYAMRQLEAITKSAQDAIIMIDSAGKIRFWNPAAQHIFGYTSEEAIDVNLHQLIAPEKYHPEHLKHFPHFQRTGEGAAIGKTLELEGKKKNGEIISIELSLSAFEMESQWNAIGIIRDITEKKKADELLNETREKYRVIAENTHSWEFWEGVDGFFEYHSPSCLRVSGYPPEKFLENSDFLLSIMHPLDVEAYKIHHKLKGERKKSLTHNFRLFHKDGTLRHIEHFCQPIYDSQGKYLGIRGSNKDITDRYEAQRTLTQSEERFRQIADLTQSVIWEVDANGVYQYVSNASEKVWGRKPEYMVGVLHYYDLAPDLLRNKFKQETEKVFKNKDTFTDLVNAIQKPDGSIIWVKTNGMPLLDEEGNLLGYRGVDEDITKELKAEKELIAAKEMAEESDRLKTAFLMNMSHEIRTPMNGIMGFIQLLQDTDLNKEELNEYIGILRKSGQRLLTTINDIIEISKIESGALEVYISDFSLEDVMNDQLAFFKQMAKEKNLYLELREHLKGRSARLKSDKSKIEGVLTNFINNAIKFTKEGKVSFGNYIENNKLVFYVKDSGIGIPSDMSDKIFERFMQADIESTRKFEGSGLGLTICDAYAKSLGGSIEVDSEEGKGSTFFLKIPYKPNEAKEKTKAMDKLEKATDLQSKQSKVILIAEDEDMNYLMLTKMLKKNNLIFIHAKNGQETIDLFKQNPQTDLILMDIKMPVLNGMDATREIRKFDKKVPIIAQTAHAFTGEKEKILDSGCTDYISKPIEREVLLQMVNKYLPD